MSPIHPNRTLSLMLLVAIGLACQQAGADAESDYDHTCAACHNLGVAGAPRIGDAAAWRDRIARGESTLLENAINGYTGEDGVMPPKGGFTHLSDEQVKAIVAHMVSRSSGE